jgi:hypothetical protein
MVDTISLVVLGTSIWVLIDALHIGVRRAAYPAIRLLLSGTSCPRTGVPFLAVPKVPPLAPNRATLK